MAKYSNAALVASLLLGINQSVAWSPAATSTGNGIIRSSLFGAPSPSRNSALFAESKYSALESTLLGTKAAVLDSIPDGVAASTSNVVESAASLFAPIQSMLEKVIETEKALNNMEHTVVSNAARMLLNIVRGLDDFLSSVSSVVVSDIPTDTLKTIVATAVDSAKIYATSVDDALLSNPMVGPILTAIQEKAMELSPIIGEEIASLPPTVGILASAGITYGIISTTLSIGEGPPPSTPYPQGRYDASSARAYFDQRPAEVVARAIEIGAQSTQFGLALLSDKLSNKFEENSERRGMELAELLTRLGPTFIKIGQSLSIRTDLLSPAYVRGLTSLQDQVPAFSTDEARSIIEEELGRSIDSVFSNFSSEPVAAASLGQVFKATLRSDGREVAIKVQRPNIMNQIALDMHLLRETAPVAKRTFNLNTDAAGTVDVWGLGFVDELDYISEAENAEFFTESIQSTPLKGVVFSPTVVEECTTGKVLTTEWVVGERLDKSSNEDVSILCSIAMNSYLTMMLETGVLHCDPHPGNLLRTPDGKLCILDWGMVTKLDSNLQITLIEHMAHLTSADYDEIPRDLLLLGFIPESKAGLINDSGIVEVLADIYGAWTKGGGAAAINVNEVIANLQDLTEKKGNIFQIPPYFAYIAKSFSVLEGIGLSNDPKYSIINECLPYVSKRLLTDKSERTGGALSTFIFGPQKNDIEKRIIDYDRVEQLISGFGDYTTSAAGASLGLEKSRVDLVNDLADQVLDLLATEEETPLQAIFIEQIAKIISSSSRSVWSQLRDRSGTLPTGRSVLGTVVDPLGLFRTSPIVRMNELDQKTIETTRNLIDLLGSQAEANGNSAFDSSSFSGEEIQQLASTLVNKVWTRRNGIIRTGGRLGNKLLQMTADKLESGEREVMILPRATVENVEETNDGKIHPEKTKTILQSVRVMNARRIMQDAEREEARN